MFLAVGVCGGVFAEEHNYYKYLRYPSKPVPGVGQNKVEQEGDPKAAGYRRRVVHWWPRKGQDIIDIPAGAPLREWTRNQDKSALAGIGRHWLSSEPETFKAHLVALRGFGTSTDIPGSLHPHIPMAVLRMENGEQRAVLDCGPVSRMLSDKDNKYLHQVWEEAYPKLYATVTQDEHITRERDRPSGFGKKMAMKLWTEGAPKFNAIEPPKTGRKYPVWGELKGMLVFETKHFHLIAVPKSFGHPNNWMRPKDPQRQNQYRKCVLEFVENFWTYVEASGASMPYWRLPGKKYRYIIQVRGSGYGGGGGWMHCGVGDARPNIIGHELFHSMPNGGWDGQFYESMCDSGQHTAVAGQQHMFNGNFSYPWRNVNRLAYKSSLWCFVLGDNPNWGYGIQTVLGSLASPAETTPYHTIARLGEKKGLWKNGVRGFGDFFGEYAARMATCDFVGQRVFRGKYGMPPLSHVYPVYGKKNRFRISGAEAPAWCGYNIVRLNPAKDAKEITVNFQGIVDPQKHSDWRACIVAVDDRDKARYSPLWNKGELTFTLQPSDRRIWLTVAGTPSAFPVVEPGKSGSARGRLFQLGIRGDRYPWEATLTGCTPGVPHRQQGDVVNLDDLYGNVDGDRNYWDSPIKQEVPILTDDPESELAQKKLQELLARIEAAEAALSGGSKTNPRERPREWGGQQRHVLRDMANRAKLLQTLAKGHRHPNGGGFVSGDAEVAKTAYVGPNAMVLGAARVEGNACIKDSVVVMGPGPVISGNAKVGGRAWVFGAIDLGGSARVLEAATVSTTAYTRAGPGKRRVRINGNVVIKGDAYVRLHGSEQTITDGLVIDYTPKIQVGENGEFKHGRFCYAARRRQKFTLSSGVDAGALYANWQFSQPQAVTLEDAYVNNNGILYGQPKFVDDEGHRAVVFNGKDQYAEAPRSVADFGQLTIDMLVKPAGLGGRLFDFGTSDKECYYLDIVQGKPTLVARHAGKTYKLASSQAIAPKKWSRLRVEMDGSSAAIYVDGKQTAKQSFPFRPFMVFPGDAPVGNFIACSRNRDEFFQGQMDHFRIYRKVHEDFGAVGEPPRALTREYERPIEGVHKPNGPEAKRWEFQQRIKYHTSADWEDRTREEIEDKAPPRMKNWLLDVRGY